MTSDHACAHSSGSFTVGLTRLVCKKFSFYTHLCRVQFLLLPPPPRAQRKRQFPTPGTLKTNCTVSQEDGNIYYVLQNRSTWTRMHTKVRKHLSRCFCFSSVFLWLLTLLSCGFFKHRFYKLGQIVFLQPIAYKLEGFPSK